MAQSIVCGGCGSEVPYGRLSCPECGELLASVAGAIRQPSAIASQSWPAQDGRVAAPVAEPPAPPPVLRDAEPMDAYAASANGDSADTLDPGLTFDDEPALEPDLDPGLTFDDEPALVDDEPALEPDPEPAGVSPAAVVAALTAAPPSAAPADPGVDAYAASLAAVRAAAPPVADAPPPAAPAVLAPAPTAAASPAASPALVAAYAAPAATATPGAYVPPVLQPAGASAPARSWGGHNGTDGAAAVAVAAAASGADADHDADGDAGASGIDAGKAAEFVGWLAIGGAALALVGFLLPWSSIAVIGADGVGYFDRWGLAGPWHIVLVIALVAILVAAVLRQRVPMWLGTGLPGIAVGGLLLGLVWPYGIGPLGGALGAVAVALGAVMLIGAGIAAIVVDRHVLADRAV